MTITAKNMQLLLIFFSMCVFKKLKLKLELIIGNFSLANFIEGSPDSTKEAASYDSLFPP